MSRSTRHPGFRLLILAAVAALSASCFDQPLVVGPGDIVAVVVGPDTTALALGQEVQLQAAPLDSSNAFIPHRTATWSSSDASVATVDEDGIVIGIAPGNATITADVEGVQGTAVVLVDLPPSIGLSRATVPLTSTAGTDAAADSVTIDNTGGFTLGGLAVGSIVFDSAAADWVTAVLSADTAPAVLVLTPATAALTVAGTYTATIPLQSSEAANSPFALEVTLTVSAAGATSTAVAAGDAQVTPAGLDVPVAPSARVLDQYGNGVPGVDVDFAVTGGGGSITGASQTTGSDGAATVGSWTLGQGLGDQTLEATFPGSGLTPVEFTVTAISGTPAQVNVSDGNGQTAVAGDAVGTAPAAIVLDQFGNPVGGVNVTFEVMSGGGQVTAATAQTAGTGVATVGSWTLGTIAGPNQLRAVVASVPDTAFFGATGIAGAPANVVISAGDGQTATVNTDVTVDPAVFVTDANGNPVPSAGVTFVPSGNGGVTGGAATTDAAGIATVGSWRLGTDDGPQQLSATVAGSGINGNPAQFNATANADVASELVLVSGDNQSATAGSAVGLAPTVRVTDQFDNPIPGVQVTFVLTGGGGSISDSVRITDVDGLASLGGWTLGGSVGANTIEARSTGLNGSPLEFTATGISGAAQNLVYVSGDAQADTIGAPLAPYVVRVTDINDNGVEGVSVAFAVTGGGGSITASVDTDVDGFASAQRVLGTVVGPGLQTAEAAVGVPNGSPVQFTASATHGQAAALFMETGNGQNATVANAVATDPAVRVEDRAGNLVQGTQITFVAGGGGGNGAVGGGVQNSGVDGIATVGSWTLGTQAGTGNNTLTATATGAGIANNPIQFTASGTPDAASLTNSLIDATEPITASSGTSISTVTVTVRDQHGNPRSGHTVTLGVSGINNSITQPVGTTNGAGQISGSWSSTQAVAKTVTATIVGTGAMTPNDVVAVNPDVASAAQTLIAVDDAAIQASNTGSVAGFRSVVTVTVMDQFANVRQGDIVVFTPSDGNDFWRLSTASATATNTDTTDAAGVASRVFFSTFAQGKTLFGTVGGAFSESIGVTVSAAAPNSVVASGGNNQTVRVGVAAPTDPSFTVTDAFGNPVGSQLVSFSAAGGGAFAPASGTTSALGVVTLTSWSFGSTGTENANGTFTNTLTATAGLAAGDATGFGRYEFADDVLPIIQFNCDGCHYIDFRRNPNNIVGIAEQNGAPWNACNGATLLVSAGNANASLIYLKIATASASICGDRMPPPNGALSVLDHRIVRSWINNGALNN